MFQYMSEDNPEKMIAAAAEKFKPAGLEELDEVRFMDRTDSKYVFGMELLPRVLERIVDDYRLLVVDGQYLPAYRTLYFDSAGLKFYLDHHNGKRPRYKVRFREYKSSGNVFLEIKKKDNKDRTIKTRMGTDRIPDRMVPYHREFIDQNIPDPPGILLPSIWSHFSRLTLAGNNCRERTTLDISLSFSRDQRSATLPGVVIAEIKRDSESSPSPIGRVLDAYRVSPVNLSKYCTGIVLLKDGVKYNRFKEKLNFIKKIVHADRAYSPAG